MKLLNKLTFWWYFICWDAPADDEGQSIIISFIHTFKNQNISKSDRKNSLCSDLWGISLILPSVLWVAPSGSQYIVAVCYVAQTEPDLPRRNPLITLATVFPSYTVSSPAITPSDSVLMLQRLKVCEERPGPRCVLPSLRPHSICACLVFCFFDKWTRLSFLLMSGLFDPLSPPTPLCLSQASIVTVIHLVNSVVDTVEGEGTLLACVHQCCCPSVFWCPVQVETLSLSYTNGPRQTLTSSCLDWDRFGQECDGNLWNLVIHLNSSVAFQKQPLEEKWIFKGFFF